MNTVENKAVTPQKITKEIVIGMYNFVGLDYDKVVKAMREMGKMGLLAPGWTHQNPFKNNSYIVAETVYHFLAPIGSEPWKTPLHEVKTMLEAKNKDNFQHWIKWPNNLIVDLAMQHFETVDKIPDYTAKSKVFKFAVPTPTAKSKKLAELLGLLDD